MVQWHPESLAVMQVPTCRPRVFIIDFETAHEFPLDTPEEERRLTGPPWDDYLRDFAPEIALGPYDPFKVDVWQLPHSLSDFKVSNSRDSTVSQSVAETLISVFCGRDRRSTRDTARRRSCLSADCRGGTRPARSRRPCSSSCFSPDSPSHFEH